jgi:hypothetical protein
MKASTKNSVLGIVGTLIVFRVGNDSEELAKELRPQFQAVYLRRSRTIVPSTDCRARGLAALPDSITTLPLLELGRGEADSACRGRLRYFFLNDISPAEVKV